MSDYEQGPVGPVEPEAAARVNGRRAEDENYPGHQGRTHERSEEAGDSEPPPRQRSRARPRRDSRRQGERRGERQSERQEESGNDSGLPDPADAAGDDPARYGTQGYEEATYEQASAGESGSGEARKLEGDAVSARAETDSADDGEVSSEMSQESKDSDRGDTEPPASRRRGTRRRRTGAADGAAARSVAGEEPTDAARARNGNAGNREEAAHPEDRRAVAEQLTVPEEDLAGTDRAAEPGARSSDRTEQPGRGAAGRLRPGALGEAAKRALVSFKQKLPGRGDADAGVEESGRGISGRLPGREFAAKHGRKIAAGVVMIAVFGYVGLGGPLPGEGSGEQESSGMPGSEQRDAVPDQPAGGNGGAAPSAAPEVRQSGVSFSSPGIGEEEATIESGDRAWEGSVRETSGGDREVITVRGPTNASFETGLSMPSGEMTVGAFTGRLEGEGAPDGAEYRATYNRFDPSGGEGAGAARGEYFISGESGMIAQGSYIDRRQGGDEVVRTYTDAPESADAEGRKLSVSFEAPDDALIPELVGYELAGQGEG